MKHNLPITLILIALFILSQVVGLFIVQKYLITDQEFPLGIEKPQLEQDTSYIPILLIILITTIIALLLIKFNAFRIWKAWFFLSVFVTLTVSFSAFIAQIYAIILALILAMIKIFKPNLIFHNLTEVLTYGGLAAIFVPILNIKSAIILLLAISVYDAIAVWKTKHMVKMAKFQTKSRLFGGLLIPYKVKEKQLGNKPAKEFHEHAILGGGDIAFPLLFSGVILKEFSFSYSLIITATATIALFILFILAEKKKYYPAMPFITIGCLIGYGIIVLFF
jgi:presenilin-like A22 family membrane protease